MSDYGLLTEPGDEILEEASELPGTIVGGMDPIAEPWQVLQLSLAKLRGRLEEAVKYIQGASMQSGPCRCAYAPDPGCLICAAKRLMASWEMEDHPPTPPPTPGY